MKSLCPPTRNPSGARAGKRTKRRKTVRLSAGRRPIRPPSPLWYSRSLFRSRKGTRSFCPPPSAARWNGWNRSANARRRSTRSWPEMKRPGKAGKRRRGRRTPRLSWKRTKRAQRTKRAPRPRGRRNRRQPSAHRRRSPLRPLSPRQMRRRASPLRLPQPLRLCRRRLPRRSRWTGTRRISARLPSPSRPAP